MKNKNNKIYLRSKIGGIDLSLFYDTGSSIFDIVTTKEIWGSLRNSESDNVSSLDIHAWGDIITLKGARAKDDWEIGT